jgi:acid phosphatase family membrane protein YuiD
VYAVNPSGDSTGTDTKLPNRGFVDTPGSHYSWLTSNAYMVLQQTLNTITAALVSDGDVPLSISAIEVSALQGKATVNTTTCTGKIPVGATCAVTVIYDPTKLRSPTGLAYDTLNIRVTSDAGQGHDFIQSYTIVLTHKSDD